MPKPRNRANGEGTVFKRKRDNKWVAEMILGIDENGKRIVKRFAHETKKKVTEWLSEQQTAKQQGLIVEPHRQTLGQFLDHWLETTVKDNRKPATYLNYRQMVNVHIKPEIGSVPLGKLTAQHVQMCYHRRRQAGRSGRTVRLVHAVLHKALDQAVKWQLLARNLADAVEPPRVEHKEMSTLSPDQFIQFLRTAREDRLHALYTLAVTVGMRLSELLGLRWSSVDLKTSTIAITETWNKVGGRMQRGTPKTKASRRAVTIPEVAVASLKRWKREQGEERLSLGAWKDPDIVFSTSIGTALNPANVRNRSFYPLLEKAGCPRIRFHDLRHTAATIMLWQGVSARVLQEVLGHAHVNVTLGTYAHVLPEQKKEAAQKVDAFLAAADKKAR